MCLLLATVRSLAYLMQTLLNFCITKVPHIISAIGTMHYCSICLIVLICNYSDENNDDEMILNDGDYG